MRRAMLAGAGGVLASALASLCCTGPILFVTFGVGAGLASTFEPLRPVFGLLMAVMLAAGFYAVYRRPGVAESCAPGVACERPRNRRREKIVLWAATALALVFWSFNYWSILLV